MSLPSGNITGMGGNGVIAIISSMVILSAGVEGATNGLLNFPQEYIPDPVINNNTKIQNNDNFGRFLIFTFSPFLVLGEKSNLSI
jgi:hypothetical protein